MVEKLRVCGGRSLCGTVEISGAKNSILPILAACVVPEGKSTVRQCPDISDLRAACDILSHLGCVVTKGKNTLSVDAAHAAGTSVAPELMGKMRASVNFLGALLARFGHCTLALPGGCSLGSRPIDYHIAALCALGVELTQTGKLLHFRWPKPCGGEVALPFPSVGATENVVLAAVAVPGDVVLHNAAKEPEITDLCDFLRAMGAGITGDGTDTVLIRGGQRLRGAAHTVLPDRMEAATYLAMTAACGGEILLRNVIPQHLAPVLQTLEACGCRSEICQNTLRLWAPLCLDGGAAIETAAYPGFPTDAQAPVMAALLRARGESSIRDTVFPRRFRHVEELRKFGADIRVDGNCAYIRGVERLCPAHASATDLRGGAAVIAAALQAQGESTVDHLHYVGRGYADLGSNLRRLGAQVWKNE